MMCRCNQCWSCKNSGLVASCAFDGRVVFWDPQIGKPHVIELRTYEQQPEVRVLAYVELTRTILVGCESGRIVAFPLPAEEVALRTSTPLPHILQGIVTPSSARGPSTECILESLRKGRLAHGDDDAGN